MANIAVIYWSGTGNTEAMANAIAKGAEGAGATVLLTEVGKADGNLVENYDLIAFGCPSMGDEVLEESEMEPYFTDAEGKLGKKTVGLFGSYDWGDGEWMRNWETRTKGAGATVFQEEGFIVNNTPEDEDLAKLEAYGAALAAL